MKDRYKQAFVVQLSKNRKQLWRTHFWDNIWNTVRTSGFSHIKFKVLIGKIFCSVRDGKLGRLCNVSPRVELVENLPTNRLAMSLEDVNTSGRLKRGGIKCLLRNTVRYSAKVT